MKVKKILLAVLPALLLSACSATQAPVESHNIFEPVTSLDTARVTPIEFTAGMTFLEVCTNLNMNDELPRWDCREINLPLGDGHTASTVSTSYVSGTSSIGVYHPGDGIIQDVVISGIQTTVKNNELEFISSYLMSIEKKPYGDVIIESPTVVECKNTIPFIDQSRSAYTSKYCFYTYRKQ